MKFPKEIDNKLLPLKNINGYFFIGGQYLARYFSAENYKTDVDVFFTKQKDKNKAVNILKNDKSLRLLSDMNNHTKFLKNRQVYDLIYFDSCNSPEKFIKSSDYSIKSATLDSNGIFYYHEKYFDHLGAKQIHFFGDESFLLTLKEANIFTKIKIKSGRLKNLIKKEFTIDNMNLKLWLESMYYLLDRRKKQIKIEYPAFNILKKKIDV